MCRRAEHYIIIGVLVYQAGVWSSKDEENEDVEVKVEEERVCRRPQRYIRIFGCVYRERPCYDGLTDGPYTAECLLLPPLTRENTQHPRPSTPSPPPPPLPSPHL